MSIRWLRWSYILRLLLIVLAVLLLTSPVIRASAH
jgi:hypothetical protein